jgi:ribosomal protein S12 methylthiotransferase accessory factor
MERYCGNWIPAEQLKKSSYNKLKSQGQYAIDPLDLVLYSQSQYQAEGFPFVPFTRDLEVYWARGWSLTSNTAAWMPASLVYAKRNVSSICLCQQHRLDLSSAEI